VVAVGSNSSVYCIQHWRLDHIERNAVSAVVGSDEDPTVVITGLAHGTNNILSVSRGRKSKDPGMALF